MGYKSQHLKEQYLALYTPVGHITALKGFVATKLCRNNSNLPQKHYAAKAIAAKAIAAKALCENNAL